MRARSILVLAMTALLLGGCIKELKDFKADIEAEPTRNPNDTTSRVLNEMKRPQGATATVAVPVDDRDARLSALESELARLRAERDRLAARVSELENELAKCRQELAQCRQERDQLASRVKELESQIAQLQGQIDQLKAERDRLAAALAAAQAALAASEAEKNKLRNELDECRAKLKQCEADLEALKKRIAELESQPPKVVEKVVEVEKIVEKKVEVPVPTPVPTPVERVVEKIVKVPMIEIRADALFDTLKADLRPNAEKALKNASDALKKFAPSVKTVRVDGHADSRQIRKSKQFPNNQVLSEARANTVADYLAKHSGIPREKFVVTGHGDTQPIADNKTAEGQAQNRRVEVTVEQIQ